MTFDRSEAEDLYPELAFFIDGKWAPGSAKDRQRVLDPTTEAVLGEVPYATPSEIEDAISASVEGFARWRLTSPELRASILRAGAALLRARTDEIAAIIALELGKPLEEGRREVDTAAGILDWNAEEGRRLYGRVIPPRDASRRQLALLEPIGPVAGFSGWNAPLITPARKISSALAAGCSIVMKPSKETPGVATYLVRALEEAGVPSGVVNLVFGHPANVSKQLLESPSIRGMTFTGSTDVGIALGQLAVRGMKRMTMELGGHAPVIVLPDVEPKAVASSAVAAAFRNSGQVCTSPTRFYVHEDIYGEFVEEFVQSAGSMRVGDPFQEGIQMGPMANVRRLSVMEEMVQDARLRGACVAVGGERLGDCGFFWSPTVYTDASDDSLVATEEPFGPVAVIFPFSQLPDAISRANQLPFGLAGYLFTNDIASVNAAVGSLDCGAIAVNHWQVSLPETPFGGHKESGFGSEGGVEGLNGFLQVKFVSEASGSRIGGRPWLP